jgi:hypothetical protein
VCKVEISTDNAGAMIPEATAPTRLGPWNPGIVSPVPRELRHLITLLRPQNVLTALRDAEELHDLTGLPLPEIVGFRPQRLAFHEVLIRVTADVSVPDGKRIEDLGINFREIVSTLLACCVAPHRAAIDRLYETLRSDIAGRIAAEIEALTDLAPTPPAQPRGWRRFFAQHAHESVREDRARHETRTIAGWQARAHASDDPVERAICRALARVCAALAVRHGRVWGDAATIARLATDLACNEAGSAAIGAMLAPHLARAAAERGCTLLARQEHPLIMNTKGPSASGKSTIRPLQRLLADRIGVPWTAFALISPDIWRKQLLDYASLGAAYKYGGAFTGDELHVIDQKLDLYIASQAARDALPHLLIDRFRFDSFAPDSDEAGSNLLTRFGQVVYLFFMITPPASLVERAWNRGLEVGRYKAVDDVLAHAIEAYAGMPGLFFTWAQNPDKRVHCEFLDNSVAQGERPRTVAFGWNDALDVLDVKGLLDVERFRRVDVAATRPEDLYPDPAVLDTARNAGFLRQCIERLAEVNFAEFATGRIWLRVEHGVPVWADPHARPQALADVDIRAALQAVLPAALDPALPAIDRPRYLARDEQTHTVGQWGERETAAARA